MIAAEQGSTMPPADDEELIARLRGVRERDSTLDVVAIRELLDRTASFRLRNAAALALADLHETGSADLIGEVLTRPEVAPQSGTLLFVLDEIGGALPLEALVKVIRHGSFEARSEALAFVAGDRLAVPDPSARARALDRLAEIARDDDGEAAEAAREAMTLLAPRTNLSPAEAGA